MNEPHSFDQLAKKLESLDCKSSALKVRDLATDLRFKLAENALEISEYATTEAYCEEILKTDPSSVRARELLMSSYIQSVGIFADKRPSNFLDLDDLKAKTMRVLGERNRANPLDNEVVKKQITLLREQASQLQRGIHGTAIVTGGASGIGLATVKCLAQAGFFVISVDNNASLLEIETEKLQELTANIRPVALDISEHSNMEKLILDLDDLSVLVLNAALYHEASIEGLTEADLFQVTDVNFFSNVYIVQNAIKKMKTGGSIIGVGSVGCHDPGLNYKNQHYLASKAAISAFMWGVMGYLSEKKIMVNEVRCGGIDTPMNAQRSNVLPSDSCIGPEVVAEAVLAFALAKPDESFVTGGIINVA